MVPLTMMTAISWSMKKDENIKLNFYGLFIDLIDRIVLTNQRGEDEEKKYKKMRSIQVMQ